MVWSKGEGEQKTVTSCDHMQAPDLNTDVTVEEKCSEGEEDQHDGGGAKQGNRQINMHQVQ